MRNESEKSVILAPFNSSISDFNEDDWKGMEAGLIIHRLFDKDAPLEKKRDMIRFAARCRDQDRQYEINNNGELDNGVYHKFVYSSRDNEKKYESSALGSSVNDLRPHSSRNMGRSDQRFFAADDPNLVSLTADDEHHSKDEMESVDEARVKTLVRLGFPQEYVSHVLQRNEASYALAGYFLLGEDQQY